MNAKDAGSLVAGCICILEAIGSKEDLNGGEEARHDGVASLAKGEVGLWGVVIGGWRWESVHEHRDAWDRGIVSSPVSSPSPSS